MNNFTYEKLVNRRFTFGSNANTYGVMFLSEDGTIKEYDHPNERRWKISRKNLVFTTEEGLPTTAFHTLQGDCLIGDFILNPVKPLGNAHWLKPCKVIRCRLEADIVDMCNLSCMNCNHLSPFYKQNHYSFEEFQTDINHLGQYLRTDIFNLIGGEPLLLPDLERYVNTLRSSLICDRVGILTNGLLLPHLKDYTVLDLVDEVCISRYPSVISQQSDNWLLENGHKYKSKFIVYNVDKFHDCFTYKKKTPIPTKNTWQKCLDKVECHTIYKGKYYTCPAASKFKYLLKLRYGIQDDLEDGIDIHSIKSYVELENELNTLMTSKPSKTCSYCNSREMPPEDHTQKRVEKIL